LPLDLHLNHWLMFEQFFLLSIWFTLLIVVQEKRSMFCGKRPAISW
jgi:hypothetical protein